MISTLVALSVGLLSTYQGPTYAQLDNPWVRMHLALGKASVIKVTALQSSFLNIGALSFPKDWPRELRSGVQSDVLQMTQSLEVSPSVVLYLDRSGKFRLEHAEGPTMIWDGKRGVETLEGTSPRVVERRNGFSRLGGGQMLLGTFSTGFLPQTEPRGSMRVTVRVRGDIVTLGEYSIDSGTATEFYMDRATRLPYRIDISYLGRYLPPSHPQQFSGVTAFTSYENIKIERDPKLDADVFVVK